MGARSLRIMAFGHEADPGGSHAPAPSYAEPTTGPSVRHNVPAGARPAPRLQTQGHRPDPLGRPADRRRGCHLIHAACQRLDGLPAEETIRQALYASLPDIAALQDQLNKALAGRLPRALRRRRQRLALDLTLIPYHGEPFHDETEVDRSRAKDGTSHFHAYASAYVVLKGQRFTVALT